jgi:hypothetical protein
MNHACFRFHFSIYLTRLFWMFDIRFSMFGELAERSRSDSSRNEDSRPAYSGTELLHPALQAGRPQVSLK